MPKLRKNKNTKDKIIKLDSMEDVFYDAIKNNNHDLSEYFYNTKETSELFPLSYKWLNFTTISASILVFAAYLFSDILGKIVHGIFLGIMVIAYATIFTANSNYSKSDILQKKQWDFLLNRLDLKKITLNEEITVDVVNSYTEQNCINYLFKYIALNRSACIFFEKNTDLIFLYLVYLKRHKLLQFQAHNYIRNILIAKKDFNTVKKIDNDYNEYFLVNDLRDYIRCKKTDSILLSAQEYIKKHGATKDIYEHFIGNRKIIKYKEFIDKESSKPTRSIKIPDNKLKVVM